MIRALLRKQFLESVAFLLQDKQGKRREIGGIIGFSFLLLIGVVAFFIMFYELCYFLCAGLVAQGLTWVYFAFVGTMATALGVIGSIFMAKAKLYEAKDNDALFSMPIPSWLILLSRTVGLYFFTLVFEALVFLPAITCYLVEVGFSAGAFFGSLFTLLIMPLGALSVCLLLGWALAVIAAKLPAKNFMSMIFTVAFMALYFIGYSKINDLLAYVMQNGEEVAGVMNTWLFPFAQMGKASAGNFLSLLWYFLIFGGLFALVYLILSLTYLGLATAKRGGRKAKYISKEQKQGSAFVALLKKEGKRVFSNPMVAMNSCLGSIFFLILPFIFLFSPDFKMLFEMLQGGDTVALIVAAILCFVVSMNPCASCSVSLEGESLWILRSMPISTEKILLGKMGFHALITAIPALFASVFLCILFKIPFLFALLVVLTVIVFAVFSGILGLTINLKTPNLHWTNEVACVKQSASTLLLMFGLWALVALLVGGYFLFGKYLFAGGYFLVCIALLAATAALLLAWITTRGKRIFEGL